jgi:hypothetical protein
MADQFGIFNKTVIGDHLPLVCRNAASVSLAAKPAPDQWHPNPYQSCLK